MSETITGITRGGTEWTPAFVVSINQKTCIGCGRCYKVCPRDVFDLIEREIDEDDEDYDDDFDDDVAMVMTIKDAMDCIGCQACAKVCPKQCHTHEPSGLAA
ncbi:ferredoxin III, nif-specific [Endothiovibrio diazotrophicus]